MALMWLLELRTLGLYSSGIKLGNNFILLFLFPDFSLIGGNSSASGCLLDLWTDRVSLRHNSHLIKEQINPSVVCGCDKHRCCHVWFDQEVAWTHWTKPWGTQHVMVICSDLWPPMETKLPLSLRYDLSRPEVYRKVSDNPTHFFMSGSISKWTTVLKVALRSSNTKAEDSPESVITQMSFNNFISKAWVMSKVTVQSGWKVMCVKLNQNSFLNNFK